MRSKTILVVVMLAFCILFSEANAEVRFSDAQPRNIDYEIDDDISVAGGHVTLVDGGVITGYAQLDRGYLNIAGGEVQGFVLSDSEDCYITGGTIWGDVYSFDFGNCVNISGGTINGLIKAWGASSITIYGTNFNYDYGAISDLSGHLTGVLANGDAISTDFLRNQSYSNIILTVPEPATVSIDIKPGKCPNLLNIKSKGPLPVAVLGAENFDVNNIDVLSVRLAGIAAIRSNYRDVATPLADANECECSTERSDGYTDLILKFDTQAIVAAIGDVNDSDEWILELTGVLYDDTPIVGEDCVIIHAKSNSKKK